MQKIIRGFGDVVVLEGEYNPTKWDVRIFEVNGHREISVRNAIDWVEVEECYRRDLDPYKSEKHREVAEEEKRQKNLRRSARRAQSMCRKVIKTMAFDELMTLTYRHNQTDRELCKKHFKEWTRRMKRALGGTFHYCASFERQERGAMHVHLATHKLPKHVDYKGQTIQAFRLGTAIWRSIVGADNGLCFVGGRNKNGNARTKRMSLAKMASYVSKYILKDFEDAPEESNRYSRSDGIKPPKSVCIQLADMALADVISLCFQCDDGDVIVSHSVSALNGSYWLCTEPAPPLH